MLNTSLFAFHDKLLLQRVGETSEDFFIALFFGSGAWLGVILFIAIVLVLAVTIRYSSIILVPFQCFLIIVYLTNVPSTSLAMWCSFLIFCSIILTFVIEAKR